MSDIAADLLVGASTEFLRRYSPFNQMEPTALSFLSENAVLSFHPAGTEVLTPEMGHPRFFYIIQRGKIVARQAGVTSGAMSLGQGECFPITALSANRPSTNHYVAAEDSFLFQITAEQFVELIKCSPTFHLFCTQHIASLLATSNQQLQSSFAQRAAEQQTMTTELSELVEDRAPAVADTAPLRDALEQMAASGEGCVIVVDDAHKPIGLLTQSDVLTRVVLADRALSDPISAVMTPSPYTLPGTASAYEAALEMTTRGIHHLIVVDGGDRLLGVVDERDLFALQRTSLRQVRANIENARDVDTLRRASQDIRQLTLNLLAQGVGAEQLTRFVSALNDALTVRIIRMAQSRHELNDLHYAWLAFGSEGRHEQTLFTDQDNGIIFVVPDGVDETAFKTRLLAFARTINEDLDACGFPLCAGNIMASNPDLCLTLSGWKNQFAKWINTPDPQALLNATIFFDFRVLDGDHTLGEQLRQFLNRSARENLAFQRMMAANALKVAPPLGRLRDFVVEDDGSIDLKKSGARLFVDAARILALKTGVEGSSTVYRLRQSAARMGVSSEDVAAIIDGFHFIQLMRLRSQHLEVDEQTVGDNQVNPETLNELDRRILKEAFRQARKLQSRLRLDYQL